jgi:glycosyltransferase involved in cell wall biosynthesis
MSTNRPKRSSVVVTGMARNISKYLRRSMAKMEMVLKLFRCGRILVYENDSDDDTLRWLRSWEAANTNVSIISERNVPGERTQRLAHGRNLLLRRALSLRPDYMVVMDMDDVVRKLTKRSVRSCFELDRPWAVLGANQKRRYYDLWALRTIDDWMPFDCVRVARETGNHRVIESRYRRISKRHEPIEVHSCFGGTAVYRMSFITPDCVYDGGSGDLELCEHVFFHEAIRKNGGRIFINPRLINS